VLAVEVYDVVKALHIMVVVGAFGLPLAYPLLVPYARRTHPRAMPAVHDFQNRMNRVITAPGIGLILVLGIYLASKNDLWGESWVIVPLVCLVLIGAIGGAVVGPAVVKLGELSQRDLSRADAPEPELSDEYDAVYRHYLRFESLLGALVLIAIFFMAAKP
jgi:uncharacterized membrane protein